MDNYELNFRAQFREVESLSRKLVLDSLSRRDRHLRRMMLFALRRQTPSDYPFLFRYSFSRTERDGATIKNLAAAVHLLQSSTFITDDIFDAGTLRFGRPAFHRQYNVSYAIIATELMQSIALRTFCSELDRGRFKHPGRVTKILNEMLRDLYLCQYLDLYYSARASLPLAEYYRGIALGAGYFMSNLARCGALLAGKPAPEVRALAAYGYNYGMALFITDDITDVVGKPRETGKNFAADLKNARLKLPMLLALRLSRGQDRRFLQHCLTGGRPSASELRRAAQIVQNVGAIAQCTRIARRYLVRSVRALARNRSQVSRNNLGWLSTSLLPAQGLE
jgi:geranylgeranyl diphosphate synthase, type I